MKECNYNLNKNELKKYSINISKVISNSNRNINKIKYIHSLIKDDYDNDIYIKTALINSYGMHSDHIQTSLDIFNSINHIQKDAVLIGSMMKIFMKNNQNHKVLKLYDDYNNLADDTTHVLAIKACGNIGEFDKGKQIHDKIYNVSNTIFIKTALIDFYGKFGCIHLALNQFNLIKQKNTVSINAMLTVYVNNGENKNAIQLYNKYGNLHDDISHVLAIKACSNTMDFDSGKAIHSKITKDNNKSHIIELDNTLIDFYGTIGDVKTAMNIFNQIHDKKRSTVSINCIMNILVNNYQNKNALSIYYQFISFHNDLSHTLAIKACINLKDFNLGQTIIQKISNIHSIRLKNMFIDFYGNFNCIVEAENIFNSINNDKKDIVTINSMMTAYINNQYLKEAMVLYDNTFIKDDVTYTLAIKSCANLNDLEKGNLICKLFETRHDLSIELRNTLIDFYGRCGDIINAEKYFNMIQDKDKNDVTINAMMKTYTDNNQYDNTLLVYKQYQSLHDNISHMEAIKACIGGNKFDEGQLIYHNIRNKQQSVQLKNTFIDFYGHFGDIITALNIFNSMQDDKDVITVNSMMKALINKDMNEKALSLYDEYGSINNDVSHLLAIKACTNLRNLDKGTQIHNKVALNDEIFIKTALIDFYGVLKYVNHASDIFNSIGYEKINTVAVNCMNTTFINNGYNNEALLLYDKYDTLHDDISHLLAIKACTNIGDFKKGMEIYNNIRLKDAEYSQELKVTLIDFFGNFGDIEMSIKLFNSINDNNKDIICINAMMEAYCDSNMNTESIELFKDINKINTDIIADHVTYSIFFKACTQSTLYHLGNQIYQTLKHDAGYNHILNDLSVQINLINMFGKCGMMGICQEILDNIKYQEYDKYISEISIWNAMIKSFGRNGNIDKVKQIWKDLKHNEMHIVPGLSTYIILIHAYSHCGKVMEAKNVWLMEINDDNIKYNCFIIATLVDCHSRNGLLNDAKNLIYDYEEFIKCNKENNNNSTAYRAMWMSLLSGCRKYGDIETGNHVYYEMQNRFNHDQQYMASAATLLANIHHATSYNLDLHDNMMLSEQLSSEIMQKIK